MRAEALWQTAVSTIVHSLPVDYRKTPVLRRMALCLFATAHGKAEPREVNSRPDGPLALVFV